MVAWQFVRTDEFMTNYAGKVNLTIEAEGISLLRVKLK
jgi:hypothetical protein